MKGLKDTWLKVNLVIFALAACFCLQLVREVFAYAEKDWSQDMTRMFAALFVLMSSSFIVARLVCRDA